MGFREDFDHGDLEKYLLPIGTEAPSSVPVAFNKRKRAPGIPAAPTPAEDSPAEAVAEEAGAKKPRRGKAPEPDLRRRARKTTAAPAAGTASHDETSRGGAGKRGAAAAAKVPAGKPSAGRTAGRRGVDSAPATDEVTPPPQQPTQTAPRRPQGLLDPGATPFFALSGYHEKEQDNLSNILKRNLRVACIKGMESHGWALFLPLYFKMLRSAIHGDVTS